MLLNEKQHPPFAIRISNNVTTKLGFFVTHTRPSIDWYIPTFITGDYSETDLVMVVIKIVSLSIYLFYRKFVIECINTYIKVIQSLFNWFPV